MVRVKAHTEELAGALIDSAGRLLDAGGPAGLALRKVAEAAGTSTMAVYTLFGSKEGLLAAMFAEGFRRLADAVGSVPVTDEPLLDLYGTGLAYRRAALDSRHLYELMFGHPVPGFSPGEAGRAAVDAAYQPMLSAVRRAVEAGQLHGDPDEIATHLWALAHGMVSLELNGWLQEEEQARDRMYASILAISGHGYRTG